MFNSLASGILGDDLNYSFQIHLNDWYLEHLDLTDDMSKLVQVIAVMQQAISWSSVD